MKHCFVLGLLIHFTLTHAQTGPAGVGNVTTNFLWLKADAGTSANVNGSPISSWNDQSGNGIVLSQSNAAQQPVFTTSLMNGYPAVLFDNNNTAGQNDFLITPDHPIFDNTNSYSFFTVTRMNGFSSAQTIASKRINVGVEHAFMLFFFTGNRLHVDIDNENNRFASSTSNVVNTNKIYDVFYDGTSIPANRASLFDQELLQITSAESSAFVADKNSPLLIGATHNGDSRPFDGYMSEIIMYRTKVNDAQRIIINNYLSAKYDIPLSINDRYLGDSPSNGNYDRDVAGIGRDANGLANSQFSTSACAGLGIESVSGMDNSDYILAGHAFPSNSEMTTDVAGIIGTDVSRWERIWYLDITNSGMVNSTNVTFDMSDAAMTGVNLGATANYVLIYRAAQTGPWTEIAFASGISGDQILFNNLPLSLDGYYTLATRDFIVSPLPVSLVDFQVERIDRVAAIRWKTQNEIALEKFVIERSNNAIDWVNIQEVAPASSGNSMITYNTTDWDLPTGISYYRLKIIEQNGSFSYSQIRAIQQLNTMNEEIWCTPNPTTGILQVYITTIAEPVIITDNTGKVLYREFVSKSGWNTIELNSLSSGTYHMICGKKQQLIYLQN